MKIELPIPMPTWNRLLAMHPFERQKCRDLLHLFVAMSVDHDKSWPVIITMKDGKQRSVDSLIMEYIALIRPSAKNKFAAKCAKRRKI